MYRDTREIRSVGFNAAAAFFAVMVIVSMFMTYATMTLLLTSTTSGFKLLEYEGAMARPYLMFSLILSVGILAFSILRLIRFPLFNAKLFSMIYAIAGAALMIIAIILMLTVVKVRIGDSTVDIFDRGIGVVLNLVFSIFVAISCIGSGATTYNS